MLLRSIAQLLLPHKVYECCLVASCATPAAVGLMLAASLNVLGHFLHADGLLNGSFPAAALHDGSHSESAECMAAIDNDCLKLHMGSTRPAASTEPQATTSEAGELPPPARAAVSGERRHGCGQQASRATVLAASTTTSMNLLCLQPTPNATSELLRAAQPMAEQSFMRAAHSCGQRNTDAGTSPLRPAAHSCGQWFTGAGTSLLRRATASWLPCVGDGSCGQR
ncbi:hypothetical protein Dimus_005072 [Dionaea muscipula]